MNAPDFPTAEIALPQGGDLNFAPVVPGTAGEAFDPNATRIIDLSKENAKLCDPIDYRESAVWESFFRKELWKVPGVGENLTLALEACIRSDAPKNAKERLFHEIRKAYHDSCEKIRKSGGNLPRKRDYVGVLNRGIQNISDSAFLRLVGKEMLEKNRSDLGVAYRKDPKNSEVRRRRDLADILFIQSDGFLSEVVAEKPENPYVRFRKSVAELQRTIGGFVAVEEAPSKAKGSGVERLKSTVSEFVSNFFSRKGA